MKIPSTVILLHLTCLTIASLVALVISIFDNEIYKLMSPTRFIVALLLPTGIVIRAVRRQSLTISGAFTACLMGWVVVLVNYCYMSAILAFFYTSTKLSKFKQKEKSSFLAHKNVQSRNWEQVLSNGGFILIISLIQLSVRGVATEHFIDFSTNYNSSWLSVAAVSSMACACADTWASEVGSVVQFGQTRLILTGKVVPRGTNGGVTLVGTLAGLAGGLFIGICFWFSLHIFATQNPFQLTRLSPQWPIILICAFAGLFGTSVDSILGQTLQYSGISASGHIVEDKKEAVRSISGIGIIDNNDVNSISIFISSIVSTSFAYKVWSYF